jgi:hypothetical protein
MDLLLVRHHEAPPSLFMNRGDRFDDEGASLTTALSDRHAPLWGDYDDDGDQDLYITTGGGRRGEIGIPSEFFISDGGDFTDRAAEMAMDYPRCRGRGVAWFDYDLDGDVDLLYLCSDSAFEAFTALYENRGAEGFVDVAPEVGLEFNLKFNGGIYPADYDDDGDLDLFLTAATVPEEDVSMLLRNDGGRFTDVSEASGIGHFLAGRGAAWGDFDNDGDLDLYVGRGQNFRGNGEDGWTWLEESRHQVGSYHKVKREQDPIDVLFLRTASPTLTFHFPEVSPFVPEPGLDEIHLGPGLAHPASNPFTVGEGLHGRPEVDPLERAGIYIWREGRERWYVATTSGGDKYKSGVMVTGSTDFKAVKGIQVEARAVDMANLLFRNDGGGTFTDITKKAGVGCPHNTGPVIAGDLDNDGDLDLFGLNGDHVFPQAAPWMVYRNDGGNRFTDVSGRLGLPVRPLARKATAVAADYDNDADLDIWVSNEIGPAPWTYGPYHLFRNRGTGLHGLVVRLVGTESNADGIGARVSVRSGGRTQVREATGGASLYCQNDPRLHFGLGRRDRADRVTVRWPSGIVQVLEDVEAGGVVTVVEEP